MSHLSESAVQLLRGVFAAKLLNLRLFTEGLGQQLCRLGVLHSGVLDSRSRGNAPRKKNLCKERPHPLEISSAPTKRNKLARIGGKESRVLWLQELQGQIPEQKTRG